MYFSSFDKKIKSQTSSSPEASRISTTSPKKKLIPFQEYQPQAKVMVPLSQSNSDRKILSSPGKKKHASDGKGKGKISKSNQQSPTKLVSPTKKVFSENQKYGKGEIASPDQLTAVLPDHYTVEHTIRDGSTMLGHYEREYEEKLKEKKVLLKLVEGLKRDIQMAQFKATETANTFDRWYSETLRQKESANQKEEQRSVIMKEIDRHRAEAEELQIELQEYINLNNQCVNDIYKEKQYIMQIQFQMADMKRKIPLLNKEKEKLRQNITVSHKQLKTSEEKLATLVQDKMHFVESVETSKSRLDQ